MKFVLSSRLLVVGLYDAASRWVNVGPKDRAWSRDMRAEIQDQICRAIRVPLEMGLRK